MDSFLSAARCFHQVWSHSQVRNRHGEALASSRSPHSGFSLAKLGPLSILSTVTLERSGLVSARVAIMVRAVIPNAAHGRRGTLSQAGAPRTGNTHTGLVPAS